MRIRLFDIRIVSTCFLLTLSLSVRAAQQGGIMDSFDVHHLIAYLVAGLIISTFVMLYYNRVFYYQEQDANNNAQRMIKQLSMILESNMTSIWSYDIKQQCFSWLSSSNQGSYEALEFSQYYDRDDFQKMLKAITDVEKVEALSQFIYIKSALPKDPRERQHTYELTISVMRRNKHGNPTTLLGIQHDITNDNEKMEQARRLMLRYHTVFNSSQVDMIYYDADGYMRDINEKACETFKVSNRASLLKRHPNIKEIPAYRNLDLNNLEPLYMSSATNVDNEKRNHEMIPEVKLNGTIYYEATVSPVHDEQGKLTGIVTAGRNITEMVNSYHQQHQMLRTLKQATKDIELYINNINYSLKVSNVRMAYYDPEKHELKISNDLNKTEYQLSQARCLSLIGPGCRRHANGLFRKMDKRVNEGFKETLCTIMHDKQGRKVFLNFQMMPITDKNGVVTHYFGMCRNETEMTHTEMRLREETAKAQEAEQLKNSFLQNMSYELRTPLNAVVGFAELFNEEHSEEDEAVFAEEIKKNTNILLQLINDILYLSRLDAKMIEINPQECDFALLFDGWCYMGWSTMNPEVKTVVENPYEHLNVIVDQQNLGMVIQKLCTFTTYETTEGMVRAKYEYRLGELTITIEDTGYGYTPEVQKKLFNRFQRDTNEVHYGTGLDLPIVGELVEQMGGSIELQSEIGKGTTFYVSIPCELTSLDKKTEFIV